MVMALKHLLEMPKPPLGKAMRLTFCLLRKYHKSFIDGMEEDYYRVLVGKNSVDGHYSAATVPS